MSLFQGVKPVYKQFPPAANFPVDITTEHPTQNSWYTYDISAAIRLAYPALDGALELLACFLKQTNGDGTNRDIGLRVIMDNDVFEHPAVSLANDVWALASNDSLGLNADGTQFGVITPATGAVASLWWRATIPCKILQVSWRTTSVVGTNLHLVGAVYVRCIAP